MIKTNHFRFYFAFFFVALIAVVTVVIALLEKIKKYMNLVA